MLFFTADSNSYLLVNWKYDYLVTSIPILNPIHFALVSIMLFYNFLELESDAFVAFINELVITTIATFKMYVFDGPYIPFSFTYKTIQFSHKKTCVSSKLLQKDQ